MAHDFGIGGSFFGRVDRVLGPAHRGARVYQVRDSPMMPAVTNDPETPANTPRQSAQPRHLPAAQSAHHGLPVLRFLFHRRRHRRATSRWPAAPSSSPCCSTASTAAWRAGRAPKVRSARNTTASRTWWPSASRPRCWSINGAWSASANTAHEWRQFGWVIAFFYALCAALRLARFNTSFGRRRQALLPGPAESVGGRRGGRVRVVLRQVA